MLDPNIENTQPVKPVDEVENTQPVSTHPVQSGPVEPEIPILEDEDTTPLPEGRVKRWPWIVGGVVLILVLAALGGLIGYQAALKMRSQVSQEQIATVATEQFMLGLQEQSSGQLSIALKRFEYVIKLDPNFPGAQEKMTEVMMAIALAQTPTVTPVAATPTLTPTPDTRAEEDIFANARQLLSNKEWSKAIEVLDALRNKNLSYRAVEADGMYYIALRFRGLAKINAGNLEEGLYDLALVERFAPLDVDAEGVRSWTRIYLAGAAYWGARWDQVVLYFAQIYPYYPGMRDASGMTALERYRIGLIRYGDQLAGQGKYCDAEDKYNAAYQVGPDSALDPTATAVYNLCHPPQPTQPASTPTPTLSPTPGVIAPSNTPGVVPTAGPSNTPPPPTAAPTQAPTQALPRLPPKNQPRRPRIQPPRGHERHSRPLPGGGILVAHAGNRRLVRRALGHGADRHPRGA